MMVEELYVGNARIAIVVDNNSFHIDSASLREWSGALTGKDITMETIYDQLTRRGLTLNEINEALDHAEGAIEFYYGGEDEGKQ